jgi:hypothetical protein
LMANHHLAEMFHVSFAVDASRPHRHHVAPLDVTDALTQNSLIATMSVDANDRTHNTYTVISTQTLGIPTKNYLS